MIYFSDYDLDSQPQEQGDVQLKCVGCPQEFDSAKEYRKHLEFSPSHIVHWIILSNEGGHRTHAEAIVTCEYSDCGEETTIRQLRTHNT